MTTPTEPTTEARSGPFGPNDEDPTYDDEPTTEDLPLRVVVDQHGHYWRDYGDWWSMCPVSDENADTKPVAVFVPEARAIAPLDVERLAQASHARCVAQWEADRQADPDRMTTGHDWDAHVIAARKDAAEYARLSAEGEHK